MYSRWSTHLLEVENLQSVTIRFGSDIDMVTDDLHVSPWATLGLGWQPAEVVNASIFVHLNKGCTVALADDAKFAVVRRRPTCMT